MYADDYSDWLPPARQADDKTYWFQILSDGNHGNSFLLEKDATLFSCPGESSGFGTLESGKFRYTHYGINTYVMGYKKNDSRGYMHKRAAYESPTQVRLILDNQQKAGFSVAYANNASFRHGAGDGREYDPGSASMPNRGGVSNILFLDGHAGSVMFMEFMLGQTSITSSVPLLRVGTTNISTKNGWLIQ